MNKGEIQTAARHYLFELNSNSMVTSTVMKRAFNRAQRRLNTDTQYNRTDATVSIKSGAREMSVPTTVMNIYRVRLGTSTQRTRLEPTDPHALDRDDGDWEAGTCGTPTRYYTDGPYIGFDRKPRARSKWTRSHAYSVGDLVIPSASDNGLLYQCKVAGTSAGTVANEPTWPTTIDGTTGEGPTSPRLQWKQIGSTLVYMRCLKNPVDITTVATAPTWLPVRYHDTLAKCMALDIAGAYLADDQSSPIRHTNLYQEYLMEVKEMRDLAHRRTREYTGQLRPTGYETYRR